MLLTLRSTFLSIKDFPDIRLPAFTLLTGVNGTGKSHILKAISQGHITTDITTDWRNEIRFFDWQNFFPNDSGIYDSREWYGIRSNLSQSFKNFMRQYGNELLDVAKAAGLPGSQLRDHAHVSMLTTDKLTEILGDAKTAETARKAINQKIEELENRFKGQFGGNEQRDALAVIASQTSKPITAWDQENFYVPGSDRWGKTDVFQQSLARVFTAYRDLLVADKLKLMEDPNHEATRETQSIPPWNFLNSALTTAGLDFKVDHPDLYSFTPYEARLIKKSTASELYFSDLSSGEKVLMSLALCLYYTADTRQITNYPKVLLLDEIDAPLHPSMSRLYLDVLIKTVVDTHNISVIATTHSPSTVALAPEDSLYVIEPGKVGLRKTTKSRALNILTEGVPTLAISFDGRRQIFVESPVDAQIFDGISQSLKGRLQTDRSLEFIATGVSREDRTHVNTGCTIVRHLVGELSKSGNSSVFGLIDWDGKNKPSERISVLAYGTRNGLENLILDPLLLASFIAGYDRDNATTLGIKPELTYPMFLNLSATDLQPIVDSVQIAVLKRPIDKKATCRYLGKFELYVDIEYLRCDDHKLEAAIISAFPTLQKHSKGRSGALMNEIVKSVIRDRPEYLPIEIYEAFSELLNKPSHFDTKDQPLKSDMASPGLPASINGFAQDQ